MSLLSALYTGVSGLQTFGESLQTIGDNIANVNTTAFKSARVEFADMLSQSIAVSSGNSQMGRGVTLDRITSNFSQGSFSNTDRLTDLAINGNGFFVVNDGANSFYTRNGQFSANANGELVNSAGLKLMGYQYDATGNPTGNIAPLILSQSTTQPRMTGDGTGGSGMTLHLNLDSTAAAITTFSAATPSQTSNFSTTISAYDSLGKAHAVSVYFNKTANNAWDWHALVDGGDLAGGTAGTPVEGGHGSLTFNTSGALQTATTAASSFNFTGTSQTIGFNFGDAIADGGSGLAGTTQYASPSVVQTQTQDGFGAGSLRTFSIGEDGIITGNYSNGRTMAIGQMALATFSNLEGLSKAGGGLYKETLDSGVPVVGQPKVGGFGSISSFSLELSNVDLATEFVNLISNQRAYQANSKIITVGDQLLSEAMNLIR